MYVAAKGGEKAIRNAHALLAKRRRGNENLPSIGLDQIAAQLTLAVDRVMAEGSLYDIELASLAVKQARGDLIEAIFLIRAFRTTLPRFGNAQPLDTARTCWCAGGSRRPSRTCPAGSFSGRPSTIPTGCWIPRWVVAKMVTFPVTHRWQAVVTSVTSRPHRWRCRASPTCWGRRG